LNGDLEKEDAKFCCNPDKSACRDLIKAYSARVFAICLGMLGNIHDAEDIAQQTLLKGLTNINQLHDNEQFGAWISRIAKNMCIDFIRVQTHRRNSLMKRFVTSRSNSKDYSELKSALTKLPEEQRLTLMLYYFDGRSPRNIAETLRISEGSVHTRLSRAKKKLRKLLDNKGRV
jgi:RNA polymerase sigma-70 factor (ECF subfamily)